MIKPGHTILLASGDTLLAKNLSVNFDNSDYKFIAAADGVEALYLAEKSNANVLVLDADLSKIPAQDVVLLIRKIPKLQNSLILFLHPKEYAFELNGSVDEYIEKPVNGKTLASRIKSMADAFGKSAPVFNLKKVVGDLTVDRDSYMVYYKGNEISLPRKEFELIYLLASRSEKVFTREEIFRHIWHKELTQKEGRTIDVHIRKLRSKISENLITTIKGIGYKIVI